MKRTRRILFAAMLFFAFIPLNAGVVLAACNPNRTDDGNYYWVGRDQAATATSIQSDILAYSPYVRGGFSYSWVMLGGNGNYMWAQVGHYKWPNGTRDTRIQYSWPNEFHEVVLPAQPIDTSPTMRVLYAPASKNFYFFVKDIVNAKFIVNIPQWVPSGARISGEMTTKANQMMGAINKKEVFANNRIWYGGQPHTYAGAVQPYNSTLFGQSGTGGQFSIWDKACSL